MSKFDVTRLKEKFPAKDIEWRMSMTGSSNGKPWGKCLAYVDARAVQDRLDEVCGAENWKDEYIQLEGGMMCRLSIRVDGEWVAKHNGSPETQVEAFKGGISKALVRASSTWGIGRYLYELPEAFATFVEKGTEGARYAKIDNQPHYWLPPKLPAWALPQPVKPVAGTKESAQGK
jgi:hypothetical protein